MTELVIGETFSTKLWLSYKCCTFMNAPKGNSSYYDLIIIKKVIDWFLVPGNLDVSVIFRATL